MTRSSLRSVALAFLLCVAAPVFAQPDILSGRAHDFEFLNVTVNPRAAALGNSFVAIKNDPNAIFSNPACIVSVVPKDSTYLGTPVSFGFTPLPAGLSEGYISYGGRIPGDSNIGAFGIAVQYIGGSFDGRDNQGLSTGNFSSGAFAMTVAYAGTIPEKPLSYGIGVKYITSSLASGAATTEKLSSSGIAADLGVYFELESALMTFGLSALNIGTQLTSYSGIKESLPFNLQFGISKKLERLPLTMHFAFRHLSRDREGRGLFYALNDFSIGGEFVLSKPLRLRFGYENQKRQDFKTPQGVGLGGFSLGVGLNLKKLTFDYAMNIEGPGLPDIHRFGFAYLF